MKKKPKWELEQGGDGQWYWRLRAGNGNIIADGAQGYSRKYSAGVALVRARDAACDADLPDELKTIAAAEHKKYLAKQPKR